MMSPRRMPSVRKCMRLSTAVDAWVGVEGRAKMREKKADVSVIRRRSGIPCGCGQHRDGRGRGRQPG